MTEQEHYIAAQAERIKALEATLRRWTECDGGGGLHVDHCNTEWGGPCSCGLEEARRLLRLPTAKEDRDSMDPLFDFKYRGQWRPRVVAGEELRPGDPIYLKPSEREDADFEAFKVSSEEPDEIAFVWPETRAEKEQ